MPDPAGQPESVDAESVRLVLKEAKDLVRALEGTAATRVTIKSGALEIEVERGGAVTAAFQPALSAALAATHGAPAPAAPPGVMPVVAPLVGVFYRSPSPGGKPFVEVGDTVERGQKVGIVEAMKVMNEVTSDYRGTIVEILVEDATAVAFEQPLMRIDTSGSRSEG